MYDNKDIIIIIIINNNVSFGMVLFANAYASLGKFGHLRVRSLV